MATLSIVVDNNTYRSDMAHEWGLSIFVQLENSVLFDTGASGEVLMANLEKLEINPQNIQAVVISHSHMDHTGGLKTLDKYIKPETPLYYPNKKIGFFTPENMKIIFSRESKEIFPNIWLSEFPTILSIERALVIKSNDKNFLLVGCSHGGVILHIKKAKELFGDIYGVIGGFHISTKDEGISVGNSLNDENIKYICPIHCTQKPAIEGLKKTFKVFIDRGGTGKIIDLD